MVGSNVTYKITAQISEVLKKVLPMKDNLLYSGAEEGFHRHSEVEGKHSRSDSPHTCGRGTGSCIVLSTLAFILGCMFRVGPVEGLGCRSFYIRVQRAHRLDGIFEYYEHMTKEGRLEDESVSRDCGEEARNGV